MKKKEKKGLPHSFCFKGKEEKEGCLMQILGENKFFSDPGKNTYCTISPCKLRSPRWLPKHKGEFCEPPIIRHNAVIYAKETTSVEDQSMKCVM